MAEIALLAGVGRATLHRWFATGDDLRPELALDARRACDEATADIEGRAANSGEALREVIRALVPLGDRFHFLATTVLALVPLLAGRLAHRRVVPFR